MFPYEFLRHCETNCFRRKIEIIYPAPSWSITFFITSKFLKNRRVHLWSFPVMRDRNFSTNLYTPHSYSWKNCISKFIRNTDVFPYEFYQHCENQFKGEKWYPLLIHKFFYKGNILKYRSDPLGTLYVLWDKKVRWKSEDPSRHCHIKHKVFRYLNFFQSEDGSHMTFYSILRQIFLTGNRVTAHLCIKIVGATNFLIHWRFPQENFWHCKTINSDKTVMPSYSARNFPVPRTSSKHRRVPSRFYSALCNKNKSTENRDAVPPSSPSNIF